MAKAHTLTDDFRDGVADAVKWWVDAPALTSEQSGTLQIRPKVANDYGGYSSNAAYDLTSSEYKVRLVRPLRTTAAAEAYLAAGKDTSNTVVLGVEGGELYCSRKVAGTVTEPARIPYDADAHLWLRLRERGGTLYYETSADGEAWTVQAAIANPFALTAVTVEISAGIWQNVPSPGVAIFDCLNLPAPEPPRVVEERRLSALGTREKAAALDAARPHPEHLNNNDEVSYLTTPFAGNFSKGLKHDSLGDPDPATYAILLRALESREPNDFEEIVLGGAKKLTNPQCGLAFSLEGPDPQEPTMPPAPRFDSQGTANEAGELYWMAVARDVPFISYGTSTVIAQAVTSLNNEFPQFGGTTPVTTQNVFRGVYPGEQVGPYVSQFLLKGNNDPRKPDGTGRDANEGFIAYGAQRIPQQILPAAPLVDYLTLPTTWLSVQNGADLRGQDQFETTYRFIHTLRDGATYVHFDQVVNAYYNAAWILMTEPTGNQLTFQAGVTGRPGIDLEFPYNAGNFYDPPGTADDSRTQVGFGTLGPIQLLEVLDEVVGRAIRTVWYQKWFVHRRLRPEEYGGRVQNQITGARSYGLHTSITTSLSSGGLSGYFGNTGEKFPYSYLLPQAYPEGAPTHPSYGAGHATGSGACATILKAFFDESKAIENPVLAAADGLSLVAYSGTDAAQMTVGGELNKLAGNIALFRNAAGVHWRSDYTFSLLLGEEIAIKLLQEISLTLNEDDAFFQLTKFDGAMIRIRRGVVETVWGTD
ncbi:MAG TPA: vanadium-dependent haloperoxidase [Longimicrobium sp.]|nr:vanadium-dependent haloperoxidase [Longimicrobium sp.]